MYKALNYDLRYFETFQHFNFEKLSLATNKEGLLAIYQTTLKMGDVRKM